MRKVDLKGDFGVHGSEKLNEFVLGAGFHLYSIIIHRNIIIPFGILKRVPIYRMGEVHGKKNRSGSFYVFFSRSWS